MLYFECNIVDWLILTLKHIGTSYTVHATITISTIFEKKTIGYIIIFITVNTVVRLFTIVRIHTINTMRTIGYICTVEYGSV
jgi:hypothetical protein